MDNIAVVRRVADHTSPSGATYACVELRDTTNGANYLTGCLQYVNADSAPGCTANPSCCLDPWVGRRAAVRATLRRASSVSGGNVRVLHHDAQSAPDPAVAPWLGPRPSVRWPCGSPNRFAAATLPALGDANVGEPAVPVTIA